MNALTMNAPSTLPNSTVDVWRIDLRACGKPMPDTGWSGAGRGAAREILARYLATSAGKLRMEYGPAGKPSLTPSHHPGGLEFNVSHSGDIALCAVAKGRVVGVDLERLRPGGGFADVARYFFTPAERRALRAVPRARRTRAFFRTWTAKEAYVKAVGGSMVELMGQFSVSIGGQGSPRLASHRRPHELTRWTFANLRSGVNYVATLAVSGRGVRIRYLDWPLPSGAVRRLDHAGSSAMVSGPA